VANLHSISVAQQRIFFVLVPDTCMGIPVVDLQRFGMK